MSDPSNPLLAALKLPGRIFQLPSRGIFYNNGELAEEIRNGEIHVHPLSALDEINMKNPDQLFSGAAVATVFKECISGINNPSNLLSKDVDAIMLFMRAVTYGSSYEFYAKHSCKDSKEHSYIAEVETIIGRMKMIDPTTIEELYTVNLPNGQVVKLQPNKYQQVIDLIKANQNKTEISALEQQNNLVMMLLGVINSVDGCSDPVMIEEWIRKVPATMVNKIGRQVESVNDWGPDLTWTCTCKDCGKDFNIDIPINPISFFTE